MQSRMSVSAENPARIAMIMLRRRCCAVTCGERNAVPLKWGDWPLVRGGSPKMPDSGMVSVAASQMDGPAAPNDALAVLPACWWRDGNDMPGRVAAGGDWAGRDGCLRGLKRAAISESIPFHLAVLVDSPEMPVRLPSRWLA